MQIPWRMWKDEAKWGNREVKAHNGFAESEPFSSVLLSLSPAALHVFCICSPESHQHSKGLPNTGSRMWMLLKKNKTSYRYSIYKGILTCWQRKIRWQKESYEILRYKDLISSILYGQPKTLFAITKSNHFPCLCAVFPLHHLYGNPVTHSKVPSTSWLHPGDEAKM